METAIAPTPDTWKRSKLKEFKDARSKSIVVEPWNAVYINIGEKQAEGLLIQKDDAPALALRILEAAGHTTGDAWGTNVEQSVNTLRHHVQDEEKLREQEELDAKREQVYREIGGGIHGTYKNSATQPLRNAVERIIEAEEKLQNA